MVYDFTSEVINTDKFDRELRQSFVEKYDYLNTEGSSIHVFFTVTLTTEEISLLETLITNHDPSDPYAEKVKLFSKNQGNASTILNEIYATNTDSQNDQMILNHSFLITVIREGHFEKAIEIVNAINPSGFIGQDDLDLWVNKITRYL